MQNNKLSILTGVKTFIQRQDSLEGVTTVVRKIFPSGMEMAFAVKVPHTVKKVGLKPCIHELSKSGFSQKKIAFITDVSQSYVSKLLKE